jgi:AraC family transcriptional regulator, regulatory protein of adaptative response / methylphosphotriester-DNA alkyltransferase methyltransferase
MAAALSYPHIIPFSHHAIFPSFHHAIFTFSHYFYSMEAITKVSPRQQQLVRQYLQALDSHIADLKQGKMDKALEIGDFAAFLHVHPVHLSNTVKAVTGQSTCDHYETRLLQAAKELLLQTDMNIGQVALQLTYDPSNFTKFFKAYTGITPKQFRQQNG